MSAPVLTPVTTSNSGRVPEAVHPFSTPAVNAPYEPPPEIASIVRGLDRVVEVTGMAGSGAGPCSACFPDPGSPKRPKSERHGGGKVRDAKQPPATTATISAMAVVVRGGIDSSG